MSVGKSLVSKYQFAAFFPFHFVRVQNRTLFEDTCALSSNPENCTHAFQVHFWKYSTRPNDFSDQNLSIPHIFPGLEGSRDPVQDYDPPIIN